MAKIDLPYVQRFRDRHGHLRHYFRKPGCKRVSLPGEPGSKPFMEAYSEALETVREVGGRRHEPGSIGALIAAWYASSEWRSLQPKTQKNYRAVLEPFREEYGAGRAAKLEARHVRNILDKHADRPYAAQALLKRLRGLFAFAISRDLVTSDPTLGVKLKFRKTSGYRAWTDADIERFEKYWPADSRARLALALLLYTGQRRQDVVRMGRQHVRDGVMTITQLKRSRDQEPVTLAIPIHPALQAMLDKLPKDNLTYLMTAFGKTMSPAGFSNWFADCAKKAGLPEHSSPHGLRKAAARRLAEAGCSSLEIAAITGHASLKEVERYTKSASQGRLAKAAIRALEG